MKPAPWFWALLVAISIGGGCDSSPVEPFVELPSFHVGQRWVYAYEATVQDSAGVLLAAYRDSLEVRVVSVSDTLYGLTGLVRMEARSLLAWLGPVPDVYVESIWYEVSSDEMVEHAYRNPGAIPIIQTSAAGTRRVFKRGGFFDPLGPSRNSVPSDSIQRRDEPRKVLVFPLAKGLAWDSFRIPFYQRREVVDIEAVRVLGRDERSARIRTTLPEMSVDLEWNDWISPRGLMRRVIRVAAEGMDENLNPTGPIVNTETSTLVAME